jgi:GNAT acetyltransferase-like protein
MMNNAIFFNLDALSLRKPPNFKETSMNEPSFERPVLEINDFATLSELHSVWNRLHAKTPRPAFCQSLEWLQLYLKHFGRQQRLRALCHDEAFETAGMTVLVERIVNGQIELTLPAVGNETLAPLGAQPWANWKAVGEYLGAERSRRHVLDLRGLPDPKGMTTLSLKAAKLPVRPQPWTSLTTLRLADTFESYWSRVSSVLRRLVETGEQRLSALGPTNFVRFRPQRSDETDPHFPNEVYEQCQTVALNDEAHLLRSDSVLNDPARHAFLRDLLPWTWRNAAADLNLLFVRSRPVAFRFHTMAFGHLRTVWSGVDAEFADLPLAELLLRHAIKDSYQRHDCEIDLGPTQPDVARDWSASLIPLRRFVVAPSGQAVVVQEPEELCGGNV